MTYLANKFFDGNSPGLDAGGRVRTSNLYSLGDYKQLNVQDALLVDVAGTGSSTFSNNRLDLSVTAGQYMVLQSKQFHHYFSGKSQQIELTGFNWDNAANVDKMWGYYSTSISAPYNLDHDGFFLQQDGAGLHLKIFNAGTLIASVPFTQWDGYGELQSYDWSAFTVCMFDFLWLGGAVLRLFVKTDKGFVHAHSYTFAGENQGTITRYPNQPMRMEIRSTTGSATMSYVCAQVSTEGSVNHVGKSVGIKSGNTRTTLSTIGTQYIMCGVKKRAGVYRYNTARLQSVYTNISSADSAIFELVLNPTSVSGIGSWVDVPNSPLQSLPAGGTITAGGHVMLSVPVSNITAIDADALIENSLTSLGVTVAGVLDIMYMTLTPVTNNVQALATMNLRYDGL